MEDEIELDNKKFSQDSFNPVLVNQSTLAVTADQVYLCPFEITGLMRLASVKFKFGYAGTGARWAFAFRLALFKMTRGTGGTSGTYVRVGDYGTAAINYLSSTPGTVYQCTATSSTPGQTFVSGIYAWAMQWDDTSAPSIPPSSVTWTSYGVTLPSTDGGWYLTDGTSAGSIPSVINTVGAAQLFQPYWEMY